MKKKLSMVSLEGLRGSKQVRKVEFTDKNQFDFIGPPPPEMLLKQPNLLNKFVTHINRQL